MPSSTPRQLAKLAECVAALKRIASMEDVVAIHREALACLQKVEARK